MVPLIRRQTAVDCVKVSPQFENKLLGTFGDLTFLWKQETYLLSRVCSSYVFYSSGFVTWRNPSFLRWKWGSGKGVEPSRAELTRVTWLSVQKVHREIMRRWIRFCGFSCFSCSVRTGRAEAVSDENRLLFVSFCRRAFDWNSVRKSSSWSVLAFQSSHRRTGSKSAHRHHVW